jgi:hypothetical protein
MKEYSVGDIIAIKKNDKKAVSCKVVAPFTGKTKKGTVFKFTPHQVLWVLGVNGRWPSFVMNEFKTAKQ